MQLHSLLTAAALTGLVAAAPTPTKTLPLEKRTSAADLIAAIMPSSTACAETTECRTNVQAAPYLIDAFNSYGVQTSLEIAGILAVVGYESLDMQYKINTVAANAASGQGTSNMQQGTFNIQYAESIPALASQSPTASTVLDLVTPDEYNFGTGPWFYITSCSDVHEAVATYTADDWWAAYQSCVGVTTTDARTAYWTRAKTAFGLA